MKYTFKSIDTINLPLLPTKESNCPYYRLRKVTGLTFDQRKWATSTSNIGKEI